MARPSPKSEDSTYTIRTNCGNCGASLVASAQNVGKKATCPGCGARMVIPEPTKQIAKPSQRKAVPESAATARAEKLRLQEEKTAPAADQPATKKSEQRRRKQMSPAAFEQHRVRAKLVGWYRRMVIVAFAFAVIKVFEAAFASLLVSAPGNLHSAMAWLQDAIAGIPQALTRLTEQRPIEVGVLTPLERLVLGLGMLIFATRMVVRTKLLDAVYVTSERWHERTSSGLTLHFLALLVLSGLLAWAATVARIPGVSDGMVGGLIALLLWFSATWLMTLHLVASNEYPELTSWMIIDAIFGLAIILVVQWPGLTYLWSRAGATAILFIADSIAALHIGASFVFARRPRRWWWHKPVSITASLILVALLAIILACVR